MMYKSYVMTVILSLAGLLLTTDVVEARGRRGGGCCGCYGGYSGCYGCYGGCYGGGYYRGCYGGYGCSGCYGGYAYGGGYGGYASSGYYGGYAGTSAPMYGGVVSTGTSPNYGTSGTVAPTFATTNPSDSTANLSFYPGNGEFAGGSSSVPTNAAQIRVTLPNPQARVWIDGSQTTSTGPVRMFHTPALTSGGNYRVKVSWMDNGREMTKERNVSVTPGQTAVLDFNQARADSEDTARPEARTPVAQPRNPTAEK